MTSLGITIDPSDPDLQERIFSAIPAGQYQAVISSAEVTVNAKKTGKILKITLEIIGGEHRGAFVFDNINYIHENATTQQIGRQRAASYAKAIEMTSKLTETAQLLGKKVTIDVEQTEYDGKKRNEVKKVSKILTESVPTPKTDLPAWMAD